MNTGSSVSGRPSMGSWLTYGLGSEADDLPGFVVLTSSRGGQMQPIASRQWAAGFLPGQFQGVHLRGQGDPVLYLPARPASDRDQQKDVIDAVAQAQPAAERARSTTPRSPRGSRSTNSRSRCRRACRRSWT